MLVFSGFWKVENNPKKSNKIGHINSVKQKQLDLFFCEKQVDLDCKQHNILYDQLPAHNFIKKLNPKKPCTKVGLAVNSEAFKKLCTIWCSKILLFKTAADLYPNEDVFLWRDCVENNKFETIKNVDSKLCVIGTYNRTRRKPLFNNTITPEFQQLLCAQVIKIHRDHLHTFLTAYKDTLNYVDNNYEIYDEEIILSTLCKQKPELFVTV